ncbi:MAG TPA: N-6 DNA methylase [Phycisphaerales bacterium]|nr:N-6 DNA methylase [Phycisphaerales bacterium]
MSSQNSALAAALDGLKRPASHDNAGPMAVRLAEALGWNTAHATVRKLSPAGVPFDVFQASIVKQPALLFCNTDSAVSPSDVLPTAALFAYHAAFEWGVLCHDFEAIIFNSHWLRAGTWFTLPSLHVDATQHDLKLWRCLQPQSVLDDALNRTALSVSQPEATLLPVDDALVDRLDAWRDETLRHSVSIRGIDERLQQLFAQLFVLRAVQDRSLSSTLPTLESVLRKDGTANKALLKSLFDRAAEAIQSDLFSPASFRDIPPFILGGIIRDLYYPAHIPLRGLRYNFAWVSSDVLGRAYEKYLANALVPSKILDPQLRMWNQPLRDVNRVGVRKVRGAYYTPEYIVKLLAEEAIHRHPPRPTNSGNVVLPRIVDPTCGSGAFLVAALDALIARLRDIDPCKNWGRQIIKQSALCGVDIDPRAAVLTRLSIWLRLAEEPNALPLPKLEDSIICGDSLDPDTWVSLPQQYDIVLGNPPFLGHMHLRSHADLAKRFKSAQGRFDYSYLFLELATHLLREGGHLGMVTLRGIFTSRDAASIRDVLSTTCRLELIVDFGSNHAFPGVEAYITVLLLQSTPDASAKKSTRLVKVNRLPKRFASHQLALAAHTEHDLASDDIDSYSITHPSGREPWLLMKPSAIGLRLRLENSSVPLCDIADTFQGIKTGANDVFILDPLKSAGSHPWEMQSGMGFKVLIEPEVLKPVVFGSDIKRFDLVRPTRYLLYPYKDGKLIPADAMANQYPLAFSYLTQVKQILDSRSSIERSQRDWYALSWPRNEEWLSSRKLITKELARQASFAADDNGGVFVVGGLSIVPQDDELLLVLLGYLNSRVADWYMRATMPSFQGRFFKFETQQISRLPIPRVLLEDEKNVAAIASYVEAIVAYNYGSPGGSSSELEQSLDKFLASACGIDLRELD